MGNGCGMESNMFWQVESGKHVSHGLQYIVHTQLNGTLLHIYSLDIMQCYRFDCCHPHILTYSLSKPNPLKDRVSDL